MTLTWQTLTKLLEKQKKRKIKNPTQCFNTEPDQLTAGFIALNLEPGTTKREQNTMNLLTSIAEIIFGAVLSYVFIVLLMCL